MRAFIPFRFVALAPVALAVVMALPGSALADKPQIEDNFRDSGTFAIDCGNGTVLDGTYDVKVRVTTFFDKTGAAIGLTVHVLETDVVADPAITNHSAFTFRVDFGSGAATYTGQVFKIRNDDPHALIHDVGKVVFDANGNVAFEGGPHDVLDIYGGNPDVAFCAAAA